MICNNVQHCKRQIKIYLFNNKTCECPIKAFKKEIYKRVVTWYRRGVKK